MAALLALSAAVAYGVGDFLGGVAARRVPPTAVVLWSHLVGLGMLLALAPLLGGSLTPRSLVVGAVGGVLGGGGVALFYRGLAVGSMSVVAPVAALLSAAVPVVAGLAGGERPTTAALAGIA
ncbi:MAG TPA: EamA family transporter, partial [Acidimicrobiales bacterium]|nr:EamA family transporter [Acidimicrobiales bacterium]